MSIYINVVNQRLYIASSFDNIVSGSQAFVKFQFNLGEEWNGLTPFAQFCQNGKAYNQYLDDDNCAFLPTEIGAGTCTLMLYGSGDKIIATTNYLSLKIDRNILVSDAESTEISQSLYDQLVDKVNGIASWSVEGVEEITAKVNSLMDVDVTVSKAGSVTTLTVTGKDGIPRNTEILDGERGSDGIPGIIISATEPTSEDHPVWINPDGDDTPDNPLGITGAGVGQLAKIAAVDADGMPTAWAADDMPSGGGTETWELAADITTAEEVSAIEITEGLSAYSKLWVEFSTVVSIASTVFVNANGMNATAYALFTSGYAGAGRRIVRGMIEKLPNGLIGGYGAVLRDTTGADSTVHTLYNTIAQTQCFISAVSHASAQFPVNKLRISTTGGATFKTGTLVKVWGCKE